MFGGVGLYCRGMFFGILAADVLYLKVDETNRPDFERAGSNPFTPYGDRAGSMKYLGGAARRPRERAGTCPVDAQGDRRRRARRRVTIESAAETTAGPRDARLGPAHVFPDSAARRLSRRFRREELSRPPQSRTRRCSREALTQHPFVHEPPIVEKHVSRAPGSGRVVFVLETNPAVRQQSFQPLTRLARARMCRFRAGG